MLVVHPASRCDVCLEAYSWDSVEQSPHAIPCGHIFCKTCLQSVTPSICPLCRKAFLPERAKKLHVDRPETVDDESITPEREIELLQQLSLKWNEVIPEDELGALTTEIDAYLEERPPDSSLPLRKARDGLTQFLALKEKRQRDRERFHRLEHVFKSAIDRANADQATFKVVEENLLSKVEDLTQYESDLKSEIEQLRGELAKYQYTTNPLPPPPQPVPLDRFPAFARAAAAGLSASLEPHAATSSSTSVPLATPFPTQDVTLGAGSPGANHHDLPHDSSRSEKKHRDRAARRREKQPQYDDQQTHNSKTARRTGLEPRHAKETIVPGASPNRRVIPGWTPKVSTMEAAEPAAAYVTGYGEAYGYGYAYADPATFDLNAVAAALPTPGPSRSRDIADQSYAEPSQSPYQATPTQASVRGLGLMEAPGAHASVIRPSSQVHSSSSSSRSHGAHSHRPRVRRSSTSTGITGSSSASLLDGHASDSVAVSYSGAAAHNARERRPHHRRYSQDPTVQVPFPTEHTRALHGAPPIAEHTEDAGSAEPLPHGHFAQNSLSRSGTLSDRASISSWGTVSTASLPVPGSASSVGGLRLASFPPIDVPPNVGRGSGGDRESLASSSVYAGPDPYYPFASFNAVISGESSSSAPVLPHPSLNEPDASQMYGARRDEANTSSLPTRGVETPRAQPIDPRQALSMLLETGPGSSHTRAVVEDRAARRARRSSSVAQGAQSAAQASHPRAAPLTSHRESSTPTNTSHSSATSTDGGRRRHSRRTSHAASHVPSIPATTSSMSYAPVSASALNGGFGSAPFVDEGYLSDPNGRNAGSHATIVVNSSRASMRGQDEGLGNALGLDLTEEPQPMGPVISAPTPIVSSRAFLRSWSFDH
ncbi:hypothetical protein HGRIS_014284 [Hohenbuehelia grisea]|uniref:RING-type domain-containing protein n=1 Tax=Hohenbuehelia grisea TaxID=104357 RepID=A0ABR3JTY1_9AGAR